MSSLGRLSLLLSSKAKQLYAGQICYHIHQNLIAKEAIIQTNLRGVIPKGYILVTDAHPSKSDAEIHYTIDAYNDLDKPIGCIHMYEDGRIRVFDVPRAKALAAFLKKSDGSS